MDGNNQNEEINLYKHFLTSSNICGIFKKYNVPDEPEYISIDVDSTDLWLFNSVIKNYRGMLFSVEYNAHFPLSAAITFPDNQDEFWQKDRGYGASLKALTMVAENHGYSLLWVVPGLDAFFIRNDLIEDDSDEICFPFDKWEKDTQLICHKFLKKRDRVNIFLDYETYIKTNGDIYKSQQSALKVSKKYLLKPLSLKEQILNILRKFLPKKVKNIIKICFHINQ